MAAERFELATSIYLAALDTGKLDLVRTTEVRAAGPAFAANDLVDELRAEHGVAAAWFPEVFADRPGYELAVTKNFDDGRIAVGLVHPVLVASDRVRARLHAALMVSAFAGETRGGAR
ncbi:hypothetical protein [Rhodococcus opacus]|uniref:Uncharacterized protein n=1 Tax=Rhodococcus opacus TaxID=37919 RepID=A0A076EJ23_RHOOP|nr:hypothetical protein [Rhodococcus opacus]AII05168.1 hypothetical protein EP51_11315 [Rhodococcus opacus]